MYGHPRSGDGTRRRQDERQQATMAPYPTYPVPDMVLGPTACAQGCGRPVNLRTNGQPFKTCCRSCALHPGRHDTNCQPPVPARSPHHGQATSPAGRQTHDTSRSHAARNVGLPSPGAERPSQPPWATNSAGSGTQRSSSEPIQPPLETSKMPYSPPSSTQQSSQYGTAVRDVGHPAIYPQGQTGSQPPQLPAVRTGNYINEPAVSYSAPTYGGPQQHTSNATHARLCVYGCGRPANASMQPGTGQPYTTCCRSCGKSNGIYHDRSCAGQQNYFQTQGPDTPTRLCVNGCGHTVNPTRQPSGQPYITCCRTCTHGTHSRYCNDRMGYHVAQLQAAMQNALVIPKSPYAAHTNSGAARPGQWQLPEFQEWLDNLTVRQVAIPKPAANTITATQGIAAGILLGTMCGDVLGAALEGKSEHFVRQKFPDGPEEFLTTYRGYGCYTDDTEMTLALSLSLIKKGYCDAEEAARCYGALFTESRGYGGNAKKILRGLQAGTLEVRDVSLRQPIGSFANGGPMRIAPVGFVYRNSSPDDMLEAVKRALVATNHTHEVAIDAAFVQAQAVALLAKASERGDSQNYGPEKFLDDLQQASRLTEMQTKLDQMVIALQNGPVSPKHCLQIRKKVAAEEFQIRATDAVATALWAICKHWDSPIAAISEAVAFGGDTDTIAAMTGALAGALHGYDWLPPIWFDNLENGKYGRDFAVQVALKLAAIDLKPDVRQELATHEGSTSTKDTSKETDECEVCRDRSKNSALDPCGHRMCDSCARKVIDDGEGCPFCRQPIVKALTLYN